MARSEASLAFALEPLPPATARFTNVFFGYFVLNRAIRASRPSFSDPSAHHVKTPTSPPAPPAAAEDAADDGAAPPPLLHPAAVASTAAPTRSERLVISMCCYPLCLAERRR